MQIVSKWGNAWNVEDYVLGHIRKLPSIFFEDNLHEMSKPIF